MLHNKEIWPEVQRKNSSLRATGTAWYFDKIGRDPSPSNARARLCDQALVQLGAAMLQEGQIFAPCLDDVCIDFHDDHIFLTFFGQRPNAALRAGHNTAAGALKMIGVQQRIAACNED